MNTRPIIFIDGPDNVGKGTQISLLRKWLTEIPFSILNLDPPVGSDLNKKESYGIQAAKNQLGSVLASWEKDIPCIVDRCHYTEYAYSILRNTHEIQTILELEKELSPACSDVLGIIFVDKVENIVARDDGNSIYSTEDTQNIQNIINRFSEIADASSFDCKVISITGKTIEEVRAEVKKNVSDKFNF